eukprot:Skav207098  [mRNA]  locus=scaffold2123:72512:88662:+ [translate_table: standard]
MRFSLQTPLGAIAGSFVTWLLVCPNMDPCGPFGNPEGCNDNGTVVYDSGTRVLLMFEDLTYFAINETAHRVLPWSSETIQREASKYLQMVQETSIYKQFKEAMEVASNVRSEVVNSIEVPLLDEWKEKASEAIEGWKTSFLEKYPEHEKSLSGVPVVMLLFHLVFVLVGVLQILYTLWRLTTLLCCCCRRRSRSK